MTELLKKLGAWMKALAPKPELVRVPVRAETRRRQVTNRDKLAPRR